MKEKKDNEQVVVIEAPDVPMSWYEDTMWVDGLIKAAYTIGTFPIVGLPIYLILAAIIWTQYVVMIFWSLEIVLSDK